VTAAAKYLIGRDGRIAAVFATDIEPMDACRQRDREGAFARNKSPAGALTVSRTPGE